jgi:peptidoglycan/xylan/chitin deacetylase (PgdA/CDA1 family)
MNITRLDLSFDDTQAAHYKWARWLSEVGLTATFYVSPGQLSGFNNMTPATLDAVQALGHRIGNHTWKHECPKREGLDASWESIERTREWLEARGCDGRVLALPYGSRGGEWPEEWIAEHIAEGWSVRDVRGVDEPTNRFPWPSAVELTSQQMPLLRAGEDNYVYAHGNIELVDTVFVEYANRILAGKLAGEFEMITGD